MQPTNSKDPYKGPYKESTNLEQDPKPEASHVHGLNVAIKGIDPENLKMRDLNPLFPEGTSPLCFLIDRVTHEELRSSGLEVRIVKQHTTRSYLNIERHSSDGTVGTVYTASDHSQWVKDELSNGVDYFFFNNPYYSIELNIKNKAILENHLRHTEKDHSKITLSNEGATLGYVSFNENSRDKAWLNVHGIYVLPKYQKLGLGTFLVRAVAGVGLSNNKKGVEFDNPFLYGSSSFYEHKGMNLLGRSHRHNYGCAQLKLTNDDGSKNMLHPLLPKITEYPLEFKKLKGPDPMVLF